MQRPDSQQWYALHVKQRFEKVVSLHLRSKGYEEYVPMYTRRNRWSDRIKETETPLFPGYVFSRFNVTDRQPIVIIPGVLSVVSFGGTPQTVPEQQIIAVQNVLSSGLSCEPWPFVNVGQAVRVTQGPLRGLEGTVVESKKNYRLIISVTMLQRGVSVEIDRSSIAPIGVGNVLQTSSL